MLSAYGPPSGRTSLNQMAKCDLWESLRWKTRSSNKRRERSWNVSMKKTSSATNLRSVPGYGFRPRRSPHQALDALFVGITKRKVNWIINADIRGFFDNISHEWLMKFLKHRIVDPRMSLLRKKWLRAVVRSAVKARRRLSTFWALRTLAARPDEATSRSTAKRRGRNSK